MKSPVEVCVTVQNTQHFRFEVDCEKPQRGGNWKAGIPGSRRRMHKLYSDLPQVEKIELFIALVSKLRGP